MKKQTKDPRQRQKTLDQEDTLLKAIPIGQNNALTNRRIAEKLPFNLSENQFRNYIHNLRAKGFHILSNAKVGYWRAAGSPKNQKKEYMKFWNKHANSIKKIVAVEKRHTPTKTQLKRYISTHPELSKKQIAERFKISTSTLYRVLRTTTKSKRKGR